MKDESNVISRSFQHIERMGTEPNVWLEGSVFTPHGVVWVSSEEGEHPRTLLRMVFSKKLYTREFRQSYGTRYLVTLAARFAQEKSCL